jgi:integrase
MAIQLTGRLKRSQVQSITTDGMHGDGGNLWLSVTNGGRGKSWVFRWTVPGTKRERVMGLGPAHTVDLYEAREKALECRKLLLAGKDPLAERDAAKLDRDIAAGRVKTVNEVVDEYFNAKVRHKTSHYVVSATSVLNKYVRATIGTMPIQKVDTNTILDQVGLRNLWTEAHPTAQSLHSHLKRMFSLAIANKFYRGDNPAAWVGHLEHVLPRSKDVHRAEHHSYVPYKDIGRFMAKLRAWEDQSLRRAGHTTAALLLEFVVLTAVRLSEVRLATWNEFDLEQMIWNVPPEKLKTGRLVGQMKPVPITPPMLAVLEEMKRRRNDDAPDALVFPSPRGGEYEISTFSQFIRQTLKWEAKTTVHGFRSTFVDWARANEFPAHLIDLQLDHVLGNKTGQAYGHNKLIEERRAMMRQWGDYCSRPAPERKAGKILDLSSKRRRRST